MRTLPVLLALCLTSALASAQPYACSLDTKIAVGDVRSPGKSPKVLAEGYDAAISPDGTKVAFTLSSENGDRSIAIADVATGKVQSVEGIPGNNNYGPVWSPDGNLIYFNHFLDSDWTVARVNSGGGDFQIIYQGSVAFAVFPDGKKLLCNDMTNFFVISLEGTGASVGEKLPGDAKLEGISVPCRIDIAPNGETALFEMSVGADMVSGKDDFPPISIWQVNLKDGSLTRITEKGANTTYPAWLPDGSGFLYVKDGAGSSPSIYKQQLAAGSQADLVAKKASQPTVARP